MLRPRLRKRAAFKRERMKIADRAFLLTFCRYGGIANGEFFALTAISGDAISGARGIYRAIVDRKICAPRIDAQKSWLFALSVPPPVMVSGLVMKSADAFTVVTLLVSMTF